MSSAYCQAESFSWNCPPHPLVFGDIASSLSSSLLSDIPRRCNLLLVLYFVPTGFEERIAQNPARCRGRIIDVDNSDVLQTGIVKMGVQRLKVKLLNGPYAGREVTAENQIIGKMELDWSCDGFGDGRGVGSD